MRGVLRFHNLHQVRDLLHHAADCSRVRPLNHLVQPGEPSPLTTFLCLTGVQIIDRTHFN